MTDEDIERTYCASPEGASRVHVVEYVDRDVQGEIAGDPMFSRRARRLGARGFALGPWGFWVSKVVAAE